MLQTSPAGQSPSMKPSFGLTHFRSYLACAGGSSYMPQQKESRTPGKLQDGPYIYRHCGHLLVRLRLSLCSLAAVNIEQTQSPACPCQLAQAGTLHRLDGSRASLLLWEKRRESWEAIMQSMTHPCVLSSIHAPSYSSPLTNVARPCPSRLSILQLPV